MFTTILVPTDGSDHAAKAVELAADIAAKYGSRVVLLHCLLHGAAEAGLRRMALAEHLIEEPEAPSAPPIGGMEGSPPAERRLPHRVLQQIGGQILAAARDCLQEKGVTDVASRIGEGDPAKEILRCAEQEAANLIVMGSRGLGLLQGLLVGSVSQKVVQLAPCTCITVR